MKGKANVNEKFLVKDIKLQRLVLLRQMVKMVVSANYRSGMKTIAEKIVERISPLVAYCDIRAHDSEQYDICIQPMYNDGYYLVFSLLKKEIVSRYIEVGTSEGERYFISMYDEEFSSIYDEDGMNEVVLSKDLVLKVLSRTD